MIEVRKEGSHSGGKKHSIWQKHSTLDAGCPSADLFSVV